MGREFEHSDGRPGELSGKSATKALEINQVPDSWVNVRHPDREEWVADEERCRATYVADRASLAKFLVPHRFEGGEDVSDPSALLRARVGFGLKLNASYIDDILGHVRAAPARYQWGPMSSDTEEITEAPKDGVAREVWEDATRGGVPWRDFIERKVLEWILTSVGGFIVVDAPKSSLPDGASQAAQEAEGIRPFLVFNPLSALEDCGRDATGFRWLQCSEVVDNRGAKGEDRKRTVETRHILFELDEAGNAMVGRYDGEGELLGEEVMYGELELPGGDMTLPIVEARYGEHPNIGWVGAGLLLSLSEVLIDLYNTHSETREAHRDASFGFLSYTGSDAEGVKDFIAGGSRFVPLGNDDKASLSRVAGDPGEVTAGLAMLEFGLRAWTLAAKSNASKAMERATASSGVALQAQFELDIKPLLVEVTETLDAIETRCMQIVGLMAGHTPEELKDVGVQRSTDFRQEDEDSRIARKVKEVAESLNLPPALKTRLLLQWAEAFAGIDLDEVIETEVEGENGETVTEKRTLREIIESEADQEAASMAAAARQAREYLPFGGDDE